MANESKVIQDLITEYFPATAKYYYEEINGSKDAPKYLHSEMLTEEYSDDMTYESISGKFTRITADVVAFGSPAPIKTRGSISSAKGNIPKLSLKLILDEKDMNTVINLAGKKGLKKQLAEKIFSDTETVIYGIKERIEQAHLLGFSGGVTIIPDEQNVGTGIRINYNIPKENQLNAESNWSSSNAKPIDDIKRVLKEARSRGQYPDTIWMDSNILGNLFNNSQIKSQFAFNMNFVGSDVPMLDEEQVKILLKRSLKLTLRVVDRSFEHEKDGKITTSEGWTPNMVVFTKGTKVGSLAYSRLAETVFKVKNVHYAEPNNYILVKQDGATDPVSLRTAGEAIVIPVLQNVHSLFYLDSEGAADDEQTEGDENFDYNGEVYNVEVVKAALKTVDGRINVEKMTDKQLLAKINTLNAEQLAKFEEALGEPITEGEGD